ncbi:GmrSD restriction endonuclease domain-containing protein [Ihuprevotella massiliensis]|uniref:GmrSD restriction endonuclease domain-containing protein n=1 Tax=Ihuprevotella massiliensis TaxID=1852368 RepID=UPI00094F3310
MTKNELLKPATLNIREFLSEGKYVIPIYQRNYDWGEREALQLLEDISDYAQKNKKQNKEQPYYIGSAVVFLRTAHGETYFETIDGQQRLTTLTILACLLKHQEKAGWFEKPNLSYDHRKEADEALMMLVNGQLSQHPSAQNIVSVYRLLEKHLKPMLIAKRLDLETFAAYLFEKVIMLRIPVPQDTQLNHYFEIMNTRGEQLEKHEVLKAVLMGKLASEEHHLFHLIWEACSDMSAYVQMNFSVGMRNVLFTKEWSELQGESFDATYFDATYFDKLYKALPQKESDNTTSGEDGAPHTLDSLFTDANNNESYPLPSDGSAGKGKSERFGSIINFPNFLLQVLKVCYHDKDVDAQIRLDDKALIPTFQAVLSSLGTEAEKKDFVKYFIMQLLLLRTLYDRYVIKREYVNGTESWSLKTLKYEHKTVSYVNTFSSSNKAEDAECESDKGKEIRLLEAMFHVSAPTQIYKHWLNAVLYHVHTTNPQDDSLRKWLYDLARCYMLDVYLAKDGKKHSFEEIVYREGGMPQNHIDDIDWGAINQGCNVQNFIFNFYDFILWREKLEQHLQRKKSRQHEKFEQDEESVQHEKFDFTYRTSVEHFYPQKPMPGYEPLPTEYLNSFGNLCLISSSMNSKFSNNMPKAKYDNFGSSKEMRSALSLKLQEMMERVKEGEWEKEQIKAHYEEARERIKNILDVRH